MDFAENVRYWREKRGLTQEALAERLDVSRQAVAKWEAEQASPDAEHLLTLSRALNVSADRLLTKRAPCEDVGEDVCGPDEGGLAAFLLRAGAATYAGYGKEIEPPSRPGSHDLRYEEAPYLYIDTYLGGERFGGQEAVFRDGRGVWFMNYAGRVLDEGFSGDFLKEALRQRPLDIPYRGPRCWRHDEYSYFNRVAGDLDWFAGEEEIFLGGKRVYECRYHGGLVREGR